MMLSFPFLHKLGYFSFLTHTSSVCIATHNNNNDNDDNCLSFVFLSQPKHFVPLIGNIGFHESISVSKAMVHNVDFGHSEQQECDDDDGNEGVVDGKETIDTSFVFPWGEVEDDGGFDDFDEGREEHDTSFVYNRKLPPCREVEKDGFLRRKDVEDGGGDDDDGGEELDTSFVSKKKSSPWGEVEKDGLQRRKDVEDDGGDDDEGREELDTSSVYNKKFLACREVEKDGLQRRKDVEDGGGDDDEGREELDTSFVYNKKSPPCREVEKDGLQRRKDVEDGEGDDDEGREELVTSFVLKKKLSSWGEVRDDGHRSSKGIMNENGTLFLEEMDENVLSNRILELSRTNKIRSAMEYFRSMELLGLCPNIHACNSLLSGLLRNGWFDDCFKVFDFTKARGMTTGHTYSLVLKAYAKAQGCDSALKFFRKLERESDVEKDFDAVVYNSMISICKDVGKWSEIERLWKSMKANRFVGTLVTYRLLISSFVHCNQSELALYAYHEMVQNGFEPNENILNSIICVCAKEGKWDAALSVFEKMSTGEFMPNLVACNTLINSLGIAGELKLAFQVYNTMKSLGRKPDAYTYNALLSSLNRANRHQEALQLYDSIEINQMSEFNIHLYNTALMSCSKLRLWDRALEILWQMEGYGLSDLTVSYNHVIRTCELARKPTIAWQVYEHMVHQKCSPNMFTYLSLIRCCVGGHLWEELEEILNNTKPNAILYNAAIQGICLSGKVKLAHKVYTKMQESGFEPDVKTRVLMHPMMKK